MGRKSIEILVGLFVLLGLAALVFLALKAANLASFGQHKGYTSTAKFASYPNLGFSLAKLVPGTNGAPSKWVNYIVTTVETNSTASLPSVSVTGCSVSWKLR